MTKQLSIGKYRALQQASTPQAIFTVLAIDHQDSLRRALHPDDPLAIADQQIVDFKMQVVSSLWGEISGVLLDPVYGAGQIITAGLSPSVGLLVELEKADYDMNPLPLAVDIRPDWSVAKIKRMSADGVKLFYYYDPDDVDLCQLQDATITQAVTACNQHDIPLYAEPILLNTTPENRTKKIIRAAQKAEQLGADILKLEFPIDVSQQADQARWKSACDELTESIRVPWVLLSAGVDFEVFCQQVEIACQAGASGFIVGRAVWGDACKIRDESDRIEWLLSTGLARIRRLAKIASEHALPWTEIYHPQPVTIDWYADYPDFS